jgi:predicted anti-sigma-YlaC factor YlaD
MDCTHLREALSARLDGEDALPSDAEDLDAHVAGCSACARWLADVTAVHRLTRVRAAEPVPDLSAAIVARATATAAAPRRAAFAEPISTARWCLFVVALTQLVLAGPAVLLGEDAGATVHVARELGSFDVALAVGLLVAAWQPARAWGLLPVAAALGLVMGATAVLDVIDGSASTFGEVHHLLDLAGVGLLWLVARAARTSPTRPGPGWSPA